MLISNSLSSHWSNVKEGLSVHCLCSDCTNIVQQMHSKCTVNAQ